MSTYIYDISYNFKIAQDNNLETLPAMFLLVDGKITFRLPTINLPPPDITANVVKTVEKAMEDLKTAKRSD